MLINFTLIMSFDYTLYLIVVYRSYGKNHGMFSGHNCSADDSDHRQLYNDCFWCSLFRVSKFI